ncbi:geminin [Hydra vulgaris]|uniref:geminin n=1 Tax=Hydra vulgaris TaxID=6087 RepID=UPI000641515A|nr:geminin [Hydra vulgaris]
MANVQTVTNFSPKVVNKENLTPHAGMKTENKLNFSPFSSGKKNKSFKILNDEEIAQKKLCDKSIQPKKPRKNLATLQPSIDGSLTGQNTPQKDSFFNKKNLKNDNLVDKAILLMKATESTNEKYWQKIAEERRLALEETLSENEKLYTDIDNLKEENERLKKELSECIYFKVLYENIKTD